MWSYWKTGDPRRETLGYAFCAAQQVFLGPWKSGIAAFCVTSMRSEAMRWFRRSLFEDVLARRDMTNGLLSALNGWHTLAGAKACGCRFAAFRITVPGIHPGENTCCERT
jgi:hypothetical protein